MTDPNLEANAGKPLLHIKNLKKIYNGRTVLDIPELILPAGRIAVLGANGSGKSTFLRIIAGAAVPSGGSAEIEAAGPVAYLPQKPYAFSLSTLKSLLLAFPGKPLSSAEKEGAARKLLGEIGLSGFENTPGNRLSGGESQRLSVARVLIVPHKLLLLDEPTSAADIGGIELIERAVLRHLEENGASLIIATHSPSQALRMCDRAILFEGGRIIENGGVKEVLNDPKSEGGKRYVNYWRGGIPRLCCIY